MARRRYCILVFITALASIGCDSVDPDVRRNEILVRTAASTEAVGAFETRDGQLLAYGFTGRRTDVRPGLLSYPLLVRIDPVAGLQDTFVYRESGYGRVQGAAEHDGEIFALVREWQRDADLPKYLHLDRIAADGTREHLCTYDEADTAAMLIPSRHAGFHFFIVRDGRLAKIDPSCSEEWSVDQVARGVAELSDGDIAMALPRYADEIAVTRIRPGGERAWRTSVSFPQRVHLRNVAAAGDGLLLVVLAEPFVGPIHLIRLSASGDVLWRRTFEGGSYGPLHGLGLAEIGDAGYVLSAMTPSNDNGAYRTQILRIDAQGKFRWHRPFGGWNRTAFVSEMVMLRDGRLAVVGFGFPALTGNLIDPRFDLIVEFIDGV